MEETIFYRFAHETIELSVLVCNVILSRASTLKKMLIFRTDISTGHSPMTDAQIMSHDVGKFKSKGQKTDQNLDLERPFEQFLCFFR